MTIPKIRVSLVPETGDIKAEIDLARRVIVDCRTGNVVSATVKEGTDEFRWLVRAAREHVL